ncbi:hypothetical protein [Desulforamulus hydrothermalis]|uniref:Uncharacterized protein n=1 Tax=Desulforamulus hydrothermalis Lam5 = DSM 18033 TaxID=1121428 RepID=K8EGI1_9FIRM|nr:hypothetical protein [Desulforamulus hydrothermalis]CCO07771.1 conserved hypothetical protein [Desulforamulus hydrothermalis Lam5 = DSM 18033]SHH39708.1 hypothetical protein SAMN02745177_02413 [Desulforamulus hydrothermalis Lam5 = DSM 18033]
MANLKMADLIDEYNEIKGVISFRPDYKQLLDKNLAQVIFCDKKIGKSRFTLIRNADFEIVFTRQIGNQIYQSRLDLNSFHPPTGNGLILSWGPDYCEIRWDFNPDCCQLA